MKTWIRSAEYYLLHVGDAQAFLKKTFRVDGSILQSAGMSAEEDHLITEDNQVTTHSTVTKSVIVLKSHPEDPLLLTLEALSTRSKKTMKVKDPFLYAKTNLDISRMRFTLAIAEWIAFEFVGAHTLKLYDAATTFVGARSNLQPLSILVWPVKGTSIQGSYGQTTDSKTYRRLCRMLPKESPKDLAKRIKAKVTQNEPELFQLCRQLERYESFTMKDTALWDLCVRQWVHDLDSFHEFSTVSPEDARKMFQFWYTKSKESWLHTKINLRMHIETLTDIPTWLRSQHDRWTDTF